MAIKVEQHRGGAVYVEDVEGGVCLLEVVPLAPNNDPSEAVAALRAAYADES